MPYGSICRRRPAETFNNKIWLPCPKDKPKKVMQFLFKKNNKNKYEKIWKKLSEGRTKTNNHQRKKEEPAKFGQFTHRSYADPGHTGPKEAKQYEKKEISWNRLFNANALVKKKLKTFFELDITEFVERKEAKKVCQPSVAILSIELPAPWPKRIFPLPTLRAQLETFSYDLDL